MENILDKVQYITSDLLKMGKQLCINQFSQNIFYQKVMADELNFCLNPYELEKLKIKILTTQPLLSINELTKEIELSKNRLDWVDFQLYYAHKNFTIIMVIFVPSENLNNSNMQFHCCIETPSEHFNSKQKFDVNWKHKFCLAKWKFFWWHIYLQIFNKMK